MNLRLSPTLLIAATLVSGTAAVRADEIRACDFKLKSGCIAGDANRAHREHKAWCALLHVCARFNTFMPEAPSPREP